MTDTKRIEYIGPSQDGVDIDAIGVHVPRMGGGTDVPKEVADSLLEQEEPGIGKLFRLARSPKTTAAKTTAKKTTATKKAASTKRTGSGANASAATDAARAGDVAADTDHATVGGSTPEV